MSLADRFKHLDLDGEQPSVGQPRDVRAPLRAAFRKHVQHRADQEAINRSGICLPSVMCRCPNCEEHSEFWARVRRIRPECEDLNEARRTIGREMTDGAARTPWADVGPRLYMRR